MGRALRAAEHDIGMNGRSERAVDSSSVDASVQRRLKTRGDHVEVQRLHGAIECTNIVA